jgi:hypothetical protein
MKMMVQYSIASTASTASTLQLIACIVSSFEARRQDTHSKSNTMAQTRRAKAQRIHGNDK